MTIMDYVNKVSVPYDNDMTILSVLPYSAQCCPGGLAPFIPVMQASLAIRRYVEQIENCY